MGEVEPAAPRRFWPRDVALVAATYALVGGALTLLGWITGTYRLTDWFSTGISMKANPAVATIATAAALIFCLRAAPRCRLAARALGVLVALIGSLTLLQHLTGLNLGIDTWLSDEPPGMRATSAPGRMGPPASLSFTLIGSALVLTTFGDRARRAAIVLAGLVAFVVGVSLTGYLFGADVLYDLPRLTGISVQMASILLALVIGLYAVVPQHGLVSVLQRDDAGGLLARRLLIPVLLIPVVFGWLEIVGERLELYDPAFGTAIFALMMVVTMAALVLTTARRASQSDAELREADRRKDRFLATLAHELRNPLAPIRNSLEILRIAGSDAGRRDVLVRTMDRQLRHMVRLVDDLLDVSRISRDRMELRVERVELTAILRDALDGFRPAIAAARLDVSQTLPPEPVHVHGDPVRLAQVFGNLLNNASKFTEPGGRIRLTAERTGKEVVVSVSDTGIGIEPEMLSKVFEMFTQAERTTVRAGGGLGIGLSLARRLVEMHGGSLTASSDGAGRGSTFVVKLPALAVASEPGAGATPLLPVDPARTRLSSTDGADRPARPTVLDAGGPVDRSAAGPAR